MKNRRTVYILALGLICFASFSTPAQRPGKSEPSLAREPVSTVRTTPAYAEVILRRTELEAELESLLIGFTEEYPKIKSSRYTIAQLQKQVAALLAVKPAEASKLSLALGKLMVRKVELDTDLWDLQQNLADGHPDVQRAKRKVEIFEKAIKEILG